ncbi:MAG: inorganic phosphate transporter [Gammaproteobacteria bacterium]|nr:inorganic phosphate transporter [Gammaproteobacteria bacterium]MDH5731699.1 inorganic phosphate transporter [Gammaproteobacteria bacterium]
MDSMSLAMVVLIVLGLAWANGANDIAKGVATLMGAGVSSAKQALAWGAFCTTLGGLAAVIWGAALLKAFSSGYVSADFPITEAFIFGSLSGALFWLLIANLKGLPVSTTHALLGGIVGAALMIAGPTGIKTGAVTYKALLPLLLSPLIAILLCWGLILVFRQFSKTTPQWQPGCCEESEWHEDPYRCAPTPSKLVLKQRRIWHLLHWLSAGATSFARGMNDVPKIAAFLLITLSAQDGNIFGEYTSLLVICTVTITMVFGGLWGGMRILHVLAGKVTRMDEKQGLIANLGTSSLVLFASPLGIPVSTTHVSTGSLMGIRWGDKQKPHENDALKSILIAWLVTLPFAGSIAALTTFLLQR